MNTINLNQLYYFFKTAQAGSLSAAAKEFSLTQPTLSIKIKSLEKALKKHLFQRGHGGVKLTPEGLRIFESCQDVFPQMEEKLAPHIGDKSDSRSILRVGTSFSIIPEEILRIKRAIKAKNLPVSLRVSSHSWEDLKTKLERHQIDMAVCDTNLSPEPHSLYKAFHIYRNPAYLVAATSLKKKLPRFPQCLREAPFLFRASGNPIRVQIEGYLRKMNITPKVVAEVEDPELIRAMVLEGDGIVAIDPRSIRQELSQRKLVKLHVHPIGIYSDTWIIVSNNPLGGGKISEAINTCVKKTI